MTSTGIRKWLTQLGWGRRLAIHTSVRPSTSWWHTLHSKTHCWCFENQANYLECKKSFIQFLNESMGETTNFASCQHTFLRLLVRKKKQHYQQYQIYVTPFIDHLRTLWTLPSPLFFPATLAGWLRGVACHWKLEESSSTPERWREKGETLKIIMRLGSPTVITPRK